MELREKAQELKEKVIDGISTWMDVRIDQFVHDNPILAPAGKYLKRAVSNVIAKEQERIDKLVDGMMLFVADKDGNYDIGTFINDAYSLFRAMPETGFNIGPLKVTAGAGTVRVMMPDNPLVGMLLGDIGAIKITEDDFRELVKMMTDNNGNTSV